MKVNVPNLFVEINYLNYTFVAGVYDDSQNFKILEKIVTSNEETNKGRFTNIDQAHEAIKKNVQLIEDKLNYVFKDVIIILDNPDYSCVNISGFKKLNGSQVLKENISYILNSLKFSVTENEKEKTILHIFNSKSILDKTSNDNLPIGLFGNFYSHELTFFLIKNNELKNINLVFNKNNLNVKKVLIKNFIEGTEIINQNSNIDTFFKIKISKDASQLIFFDKASFRYAEHFNFGSDIIFKDITKVCSINHETIEKILLDRSYENKKFEENEFLDEKYFIKMKYRKVRKKLIKDIVDARIEEIVNIILNKNINIKSLKENNGKIYFTIKDKLIFDNFKNNFKFYFSQDYNFESHFINELEIDSLFKSGANLTAHGWKKEAVPITQSKNSLITKIFKSLFG